MNPIASNGRSRALLPILSANGVKSPIEMESDPKFKPSDGNDRNYARNAAKYSDDYWEVEWRIEVNRNTRLSDLRGQIATKAKPVTSLRDKIGTLPQRLAELRGHQHDLRTTEFKDNYRASIPIGILYTVVGFALFIADLPLSLQLVTNALGIASKVDNVSVDQLFKSPLQVIFGPTWEAMFLACGIAFSGMFVKYFLEEVILSEKLNGLPADSIEPLSKSKKRALWLIFVLFFSTTVVLGIFRASALDAKLKAKNANTEFSLDQTQSTAQSPAAATSPQSKQTDRSLLSLISLESVTFTLLTLMFPIVGGVCFSAGSRRLADGCRRLKRIGHYFRVWLSVTWTEWKYQRRQKKFARGEGELGRLQELLKQEQDDATNNASKQLLLNLYRHGYMRGRTLPETLHVEAQLYPQAKRVVEKFMARDLRTRLWEDVKTNGASAPKN